MQRGLNTFGAYVRRAGKQVHLGSFVTAPTPTPTPTPNPNPNPNPKQVHLGSFVTAEEAALAFARTPEAQAQVAAAEAKQASLAAKEALAAQAAAGGVITSGPKLKPNKVAPGYKGTPNQGYKGVGPRGDRGAGDGRSPRLSETAAGSTKGVVGSSEAAEATAHEAAARQL